MNHYTEAHIDFMAVKLAKRPNSCSAPDLDHASSMLTKLVRDCNELREQLAANNPILDEAANELDRQADEIESLRQQLAAAQSEINEQARIVGMGGQREIALRQQVALLREALLEISQVACSLSPEQKIANETLAATEPR